MSTTKPIIPDNLLAYRTWYNSTISETLPMCTRCKVKPMLWCTDKCEYCAATEDLLTEMDILGWHVDNFPPTQEHQQCVGDGAERICVSEKRIDLKACN